jgi:hypothetical protein
VTGGFEARYAIAPLMSSSSIHGTTSWVAARNPELLAVAGEPVRRLLSKGEPLGASGLGQIHEIVHQLRGTAAERQVEGASWGLSHVMGAGHDSGVVVLSR